MYKTRKKMYILRAGYFTLTNFQRPVDNQSVL